ncbi:hypothetical protein ACHIPZ_24810 [Antrihabitans sp. NCIMB 15449]|uniref:Uncharacterized protein n=1 Tax=Antrihabitans spumae TaxID=3373370 RepID=A0ABW7JU76_9NOCA
MDLVALALASPRGRFFAANVAYKCSPDDIYFCRPITPKDVRDVVRAVDIQAVARLSELDLLDALSLATDFARYWQPPDDEDVLFADPEVVETLRPVIAAALDSPHARWWGETVDLDDQRLVVHPYSVDQWPESTEPYRPSEDHLELWRQRALEWESRFRSLRIDRPDHQVGGEWWSTPAGNTLSTSRSRDGLGALELLLEEDSSGCGEARVWPVHVLGTPRVYEIAQPTDWASLVDSYPFAVPESKWSDWFVTTGERHDWFIPDWVAVAEDYDAVHLSIYGYLTTPGLAIPLSHNSGATVLAGWDPDATWWLNNDVITVEDEPTLWSRDDEGWRKT